MSVVAAGIIGSAVVGAYSSSKAGDAASDSAQQQRDAQKSGDLLAKEASDAQLAFQQQQYDDWQNVYGDIQANLSNYYGSMTPDSVTALGLQNIEASYSQSKLNLDRTLAQRGITNSGINAQAQTSLEISRMNAGAELRQAAPQMVAQQQMGFLGAGLGLESTLQQGISSAYSQQMNLGVSQANTAAQLEAGYSQQAASAQANIGATIGQGISTYATYNALNKPTVLNPQTGGTGIYGLDYR